MSDADAQLHRAIANALWPHLKADAWTQHRVTRDLSPTGAPRRGWSSTPATPGPTPTLEVITVTWLMRVTVWSWEWPGGASWRVTLDRVNAVASLAQLPYQTIFALESAYHASTCRKPFSVERNEHGARTLVRNRHDGAITQDVATALEAVASAATLRAIPPEVEARVRALNKAALT